MSNKLLLTSFQTWLPHQISNSADDLLETIQKQRFAEDSLFFLRKLPVDIKLASGQVIETIKAIKPTGILCCGMAESREKLTVESNAVCQEDCIFTMVDLNKMITCLAHTEVSHNAGKFVCEGLYYEILKYTQANTLKIPCIFIHVPLLNARNTDIIQKDFTAIINFLL